MPVLAFEDRPSDSPFIERVWQSRSETGGSFRSIAACHWEMVVIRHEGTTSIRVRGPESRPSVAECPAEGEWFAIRFKLGTFTPLFPASALRDRQDAALPAASSRSFWLHGSSWEYPNFENAEVFVGRLVRSGLVMQDRLIADALSGAPARAVARTRQRRFLAVTGLTEGTIRQIERARRAIRLLRQGSPIAAAAYAAGYFDQAHLTRSVGRWVGLTPAEVAKGGEQLSFLYNTDAS